MEKNNYPDYIKTAIRFIITALLLCIVLYKIDLSQFKTAFSQIKLPLVIIIWLVALICFWLKSIKLRYILAQQNCDTKASTIMASSMITTLYSLIMPGPVSSGVKWYILKKNTGKGSNVFSSMIYNQASEIIPLTVIGLLSTAVITFGKNTAAFIASIAAVIFITAATVFTLKADKLMYKIKWHSFLPAKIASKLDNIFSQLTVFQTIRFSFHFNNLLLTVAGGVLSILIYVLAANAVNISVPISLLASQCILVYLLSRLPISFANLGVREYTLVEMLSRYNVESSQALMMSLVIFSNVLFIAVIGAFCQLFWFNRITKTAVQQG